MKEEEETDLQYRIIKSATKILNNKGYTQIKTPSYSDYKNFDRIIYLPNTLYMNSEENKNDSIQRNIILYIVSETFNKEKLNSSIRQIEKKYKDIHKIYYIFGNCGIQSYTFSPTGHVRKEINKNEKIEIIENVLPFDMTVNINFPTSVYILNKQEEKQLLSIMKIKPEHLSHIHETDPLCRIYCAEPGRIIKIVQRNGSINYKYVIHNN